MGKKDKRTARPKYNLWQASAYMVRIAWKKQKSVLVLCVVMAVLEILLNLTNLFVVPVILQKIELLVSLRELIETILWFAFILMVLRMLKAYVSSNLLFGRIAVRMHLVTCINNKISTTSYPNTEDTAKLKMLEKANMAVCSNYDASEAIWNTLTDLLKNVSCFVIYICLLSVLNPGLIAMIIIITGMDYFISQRIYEWGYRHREEESLYSKKLNYICNQISSLELAKDIRIFGMDSWLNDIYNKTIHLYQAFIARREKVYIWANLVDVALSLIQNGAAYVYLILFTIENGMAASDFLIYFTAISGFTNWITGILSVFSTLKKQCIDISGIREYLEEPEIFSFEEGEKLEVSQCGNYEIHLKNVSFRYPGAKKDTLHNMNLIIHPGEKLAVVGLNGAGKTTLVKLICGFYEPTQGEILLNGQNIKKYNRKDYYTLFSAVFQDFSLLEVSLCENVAQSAEKIDMEKVERAIRNAGLERKVKHLPRGYETHIGRKVYDDGVELSGGEMQRLMLARALYKDAPVIILDEPTAALDSIAENDIYQRYNELTCGKTAVYISHRLASTKFCDRIILIENGMIAEEGTHESLLKSGGIYAKLFQTQSYYYKEGSEVGEKSTG